MEQKDIKAKYMEFQMMDQQLKEMQKQIQMIDERLMDLQMIGMSLDDFKKSEVGAEMLVPLSPGIYARAELKDSKELIINVGSNVAVKKSVEDSKELLLVQRKDIEKVRNDMLMQMTDIDARMRIIEEDIIKSQNG